MKPLMRILARLRADDAGAAAVTATLALVSLLGFAGLAIDVGGNYMLRRQAQTAVDSAAFTGAVAMGAGGTDFAAQAQAITDQYGLTDQANGVTVTVNNPPASGPHAGMSNAIEVIVQRPAAFFFASLFQPHAGTIMARAVATAGTPPTGCLYVLNPNAPNALLLNGGAAIQVTNCSVYDNSTSSTALLANGGATLSAKAIDVAGGDLLNGNPTINGSLQTHASGTADPHASLTLSQLGVPPSGNCDSTALASSQSFSAASPHVFCGGLTLSGSDTFNPGLYVFNGPVVINGSTTVNGSGVTFVFKGSSSITINGNATVNLSAPTSGADAGFVMVKDPSAPAGSMNIFNGADKLNITGALYFPHQSMILNGTANLGACASLIVDTLIVNGGASYVSDCSNSGSSAAKLVE